jgi:ABC-type uncharacterized transport system YnjBCD substrate-binding protein
MNFHKNHLTHWIAVLAIAMSALAPAASQAVSLAKYGQGFAMEICSTDGTMAQMNVQSEDQSVVTEGQACPYCLAQNFITPSFSTSLTFQVPQTLALLPQLFYQSPKRFTAWITPPSAAPPTHTLVVFGHGSKPYI